MHRVEHPPRYSPTSVSLQIPFAAPPPPLADALPLPAALAAPLTAPLAADALAAVPVAYSAALSSPLASPLPHSLSEAAPDARLAPTCFTSSVSCLCLHFIRHHDLYDLIRNSLSKNIFCKDRVSVE